MKEIEPRLGGVSLEPPWICQWYFSLFYYPSIILVEKCNSAEIKSCQVKLQQDCSVAKKYIYPYPSKDDLFSSIKYIFTNQNLMQIVNAF